jgi:3-oxoacyl-[acyl-carrier-protein] synthase-1
MNESLKVLAWEGAAADDDICVVGLGARTAVGTGVQATAAAVRAGISGLSLHPRFVDQGGEPVSFACDPALDPDLPIVERMAAMLHAASQEAVASAASITPDGCLLALPEHRVGLPTDLESTFADALGRDLKLPRDAVRTLSGGHAGGLMALQSAAQWLSQRLHQAVLVIGVDSYHDEQTLHSLEIHRRLKNSQIRGGFLPGEAAGACLLVRKVIAERAAVQSLAKIRSAATAVEPNPLRTMEPCIGKGLTAAIAAATQNLRLPNEQITLSYCDLNGERFRNEEFVFAQLRTQDSFLDANDYVSPADCWGDVGAASGPLFVALAAASKLRGYAKGSLVLLWTSSDRGYRSAVTLSLEQIGAATR